MSQIRIGIGSGLELGLDQDRIKLGRGGFWVDSKLSWIELG
jgi:hypothetical protein